MKGLVCTGKEMEMFASGVYQGWVLRVQQYHCQKGAYILHILQARLSTCAPISTLYEYICADIFTVCESIYGYMYQYMYVHLSLCVNPFLCKYVCMRTRTHVCMYIYECLF